MNYRSPIDIIQSEIQTAIENEIYKAVVNVGINVDKAELLKALTYDRNQYIRGYNDRDNSIVRCRNCKYWQDNNGGYPHPECRWGHDETPDADDYCSFGEVKE